MLKCKTQINKKNTKNTIHHKKHPTNSEQPLTSLKCGRTKVKYPVSEQKEVIEDTQSKLSTDWQGKKQKKNNVNDSATVESPPMAKKKTLIIKSSTSEADTLITQSLKILVQALIGDEKASPPCWIQRSKGMLKRSLLPTEIDCAGSVLNVSKKSLITTVDTSWFSIEKIHPQKKNSSMTSSQLSLLSQVESTDSEVVKLKKPLETQKKLKTMKFRVFPRSEKQKKQFQDDSDAWRWYYNFNVDAYNYGMIKNNEGKEDMVHNRDIMRKYGYEYIPLGETNGVNFIEQRLVERDTTEFFYVPDWLEKRPHNRVIRGAMKKFEDNVKSAKSNKRNGNIKNFEMKFRSRKKDDYISFEDSNFPAMYKKLDSYYGYRTKDKRRFTVTAKQVADDLGWSGCIFIHEKLTDKYYLLFAVPVDYFPSGDRRSDCTENQGQSMYSKTGKTISLDPGMRKFLVGWCPDDNHVLIVDRSKKITRLLLDIDKTKDKEEKQSKWSKMKNYINELHWRTIRYLVGNYDTIILGDININSIMKSGIYKLVKRVLQQYSFYQFKQKLSWVCSITGKKLILVDEKLTSKKCCGCGDRTDVGGAERYICDSCSLSIDRDINASINIFLKAYTELVVSS